MNSTMKTVLPILLVIAMVFGLTFMSQFTAPTKQKETEADGDAVDPLIVGNSQRYVGYFEVGTGPRDNRIDFFVRNGRPSSVFLTALPPGCPLCTTASGAVIPPDALTNHLVMTGMSPLWGATPTGDLLSAISWAQTRAKLNWHTFEFSNAKNRLELPGSTESAGESWAVLELGYDVKDVAAPAVRAAYFDAYDAKDHKLLPQPYKFEVFAGGREAQELAQTEYNLGTLTESHPTQVIEVLCVSAHRDELPKPTVAVGNNDPHVSVSPPEPIDRARLDALSHKASTGTGQKGEKDPPPIYYRSGYSYRVSVSRDANGKSMDVGPFDKEIYFGGAGGVSLKKPLRVHVIGTVVGVIQMEAGTKVDFGSYDSNFAQKKDVRLWTEKKGVELELVPEQIDPNFLKVTLGTPTSEAGRTYWPMGVQIPAREGKRPPWDGILFLRTKGPNPVNVRIPVTGYGR